MPASEYLLQSRRVAETAGLSLNAEALDGRRQYSWPALPALDGDLVILYIHAC